MVNLWYPCPALCRKRLRLPGTNERTQKTQLQTAPYQNFLQRSRNGLAFFWSVIMEVPRKFSSDVSQDVDVIVTVVCGHSILDIVKLQGSSGPLPSVPSKDEVYDDRLLRRKEADAGETDYLGRNDDGDFHVGQESEESAEACVHKLTNSSNNIQNLLTDHEEESSGRNNRTGTSLTRYLSLDPMLASCLTTELKRSKSFESAFRIFLLCSMQRQATTEQSNLADYNAKHFLRQECGSILECHRPAYIQLRLRLSSKRTYFRMEPDIRWSHRMLPQWIQRAQIEDAFSWLSTLGGAYSSLGDNMYNCALEAGRVAIRQLYLAECLGDELLRCRCLLYIALSLMQRGQLAKAKRLVRQQYKFATSKTGCLDTRLVSMCQGIWHHLRHHYAKRKET